MSETAERSRSLVTLGWVAAAGLLVLSATTYVAFDRTVCPGGDGPAMAEASAQAIVCGEGAFYPWATVVWIIATVGGLLLQWYAVTRMRASRQQLLGVLLPVLAPLLLFVIFRLPSESCTDEVRRTEPAERCAEPG